MPNFCRTCIQQVTDNSSVSVNSKIDYERLLLCCVPEMDLRIISDMRICNNCLTTMNVIYKFKIRHREIEYKIIDYLNEHGIVDLTRISRLLFKNQDELLKIKREFGLEETICRTCLRQITTSLIFLDEPYKHKLLLCIPELDMWIIPDIKMCRDCHTDVDMAYDFKMRCLENEETINNYLKEHNIVDAKCLLKWFNCIIKTEPNDREFKIEQLLIKQEQIDLDDNHLQRDLCEDKSGEEEDLANLLKYASKNNFKCSMCEYSTAHKSKLKQHILSHTGEKPFKCLQCEYSTVRKWLLRRHMHKHTGEKPFKCLNCDYRASDRSSLKQHMRTHTGEKPFQCLNCEYRASRKSHLKQHMRTHTREKPFKCLHCEYSTTQKYSLTLHMHTHTGEKPFQCLNCEYRTSQKSNLKQHMRAHTGENPFKCLHCKYRTTRKYSLILHMHTHIGKKSFQCLNCKYRASRKSHLKLHMRTHISEKPFKCLHCTYGTTRKSTLRGHITHKCTDE